MTAMQDWDELAEEELQARLASGVISANDALAIAYASYNANPRLEAHRAAVALADMVSANARREPLVRKLIELWLSDDDNLNEIQCALEDLSRWKP